MSEALLSTGIINQSNISIKIGEPIHRSTTRTFNNINLYGSGSFVMNLSLNDLYEPHLFKFTNIKFSWNGITPSYSVTVSSIYFYATYDTDSPATLPLTIINGSWEAGGNSNVSGTIPDITRFALASNSYKFTFYIQVSGGYNGGKSNFTFGFDIDYYPISFNV